jgi:phage FluMu protein Com
MDSDCPFGIFWPLCCLFFFDIQILITPLERYQRGNQNLYIKEEQTTQWPKDAKGAIRIYISKKNRQHNGQRIPKGQSESVYQRRTDNTMAKRYQRCNQNLYIKEEQTTQWPKDTKGAIRF